MLRTWIPTSLLTPKLTSSSTLNISWMLQLVRDMVCSMKCQLGSVATECYPVDTITVRLSPNPGRYSCVCTQLQVLYKEPERTMASSGMETPPRGPVLTCLPIK